MKPYLILVSHGRMAEETLRSAEMITGPIVDATAVCMGEQEGMTGFSDKLLQAAAAVGDDRSLLVLADLYGGTPCNVTTAALLRNPRVRLVAGMNLAMVIEYASSQTQELEEMAEELAAIGKISVKQVQPLSPAAGADDDDEIECD